MNCLLCGRPVHDAYLCPGDALALDENLVALGPLYEDLAAFMQPAGRGIGGRVSTATDAPLPVAEGPLTLRGPGGLVQVVEDWLSALHCDLEWSQPRVYGTYEERLKRAVDGLRVNVLWIASSWPTAGVLAGEVRDLVKAARSITDPPERTVRAGYCVTPAEDGGTCGAVLRYTPGDATVRCAWCRTEYPTTSWLALAAGQPELKEAS